MSWKRFRSSQRGSIAKDQQDPANLLTRCDVSDALCKMSSGKAKNGGFLSGLTMWSPQRQEGKTKIVGPAYTVRYAPLDDPAPKYPTHYVSSCRTIVLRRGVLTI